MSLLQIEHLYAGYGKNDILKDVSLTVEKGQLAAVIGPNGSGKSTLMKSLCRAIEYRGDVRVDCQNLLDFSEKELARKCSYVPQKSGLSLDITLLEVVLMGFYPYLGLLERPGVQMRERAQDMLARMGLPEQIDDNYMEVSEGQKRLCILARGLVADPELLLMDEPDASLDFDMKNQLLNLLAMRVKEEQNSALLCMHDINLALAYSDLIYIMKDGELINMLNPKEETLEQLERKMRTVYINSRLLTYERANGEKKLVMVQD